MQPGLRRLAEGEPHLHALEPGCALWQEKLAVVQAGQALHCQAGFDPTDAINSIAAKITNTLAPGAFDQKTPLALQIQEDLAVLCADGTVPWLCVCVPSHWAPEDKLGLQLAQIHAPVADGQAIRAASTALARLVTDGQGWERQVWTISPSSRYDQHPQRHAPEPWPATDDPQVFAQGCWLRSERQTFFPVHDSKGQLAGQSVFTIRVQLLPLVQALDQPLAAQRLAASLASMSDAVLAYKGLAGARAPLLQWLARHPAHGT